MGFLSNLRGLVRKIGRARKGGGLRAHIPPEVFRAPAGRVAEELYPEVVRELRATDPQAELLYIGKGKWMLGCVWPCDQRRERAAIKIQEHLRSSFSSWDWFTEEWCRAVRAGFRSIEVYTDRELFEGSAAADFRLRDYNWRTSSESVRGNEFVAAADDSQQRLEEDLAYVRDKLHSEVRSLDRYVFRHSKGFHQRRAFPGARATV